MFDNMQKGVLGIEVDATGAKAAIADVKNDVVELGTAAAAAGKQASGGINAIGESADSAANKVDGAAKRLGKSLADLPTPAAEAGQAVGRVGDGGDAAARKIDSATRSMIGSIQRATAAMEAGSKGSTEYYRVLAGQRGVDANVLKPYLDKLDAVSAGQAKAGMSAKEMAFALRGLPAQLTDIVVSLQAGQQPLTVLLQQGGQLKDMFGGIGPAMRAMGGYVLGLIGPLSLLTVTAAALAFAYYKGSQEQDAYTKALRDTNNAVGLTADGMADMAHRISAVSGTTGAAAEAIAALAATGQVAGSSLERLGATISSYASAAGADVNKLVDDFSALGKDPVDAAVKLDEKYRFLTATIYEQIKSLEDQGRATDAASAAQDALAQTLDRRKTEIISNLGHIETMWKWIKSAIVGASDAMLEFGRKNTAAQDLAQKRIELARLDAGGQGAGSRAGKELPGMDGRRKTLQDEISALESDMRRAQIDASRAAEKEAERSEQVKSKIEFDAWKKSNRSRVEQRDDELKKLRGWLDKKTISQDDYEKGVLTIQEKYKERTRKGKKSNPYGSREDRDTANIQSQITAERQLTDVMSSQGAAYEKLTGGEREAIKYRAQISAATGAAAKSHLEYVARLADELGAQQSLNRAIADRIKTSKALDDRDRQRGFETQMQNEESARQLELMQLTGRERAVAQAQWDVEKAVRRERFDLEKQITDALDDQMAAEEALARIQSSGNATAIETARRTLAERQRIVRDYQDEVRQVDISEATRQRDAATRASAEYAMTEWKRASEQIEQSLTDSLMRGFESGKSMAQSLRDSIVNAFKSMVVRVAVQPVMGVINGVGQAVAGEAAGNGGSGASSLISNGKSLYDIYDKGLQANSIGNLAAGGTQWLAESGFGKTIGWYGADGLTQSGADAITSIGNFAQNAGTMLSWASVVVDAFKSFKTGEGWGKTIGAGIGTYILPGIGTIIGGVIGGFADSLFGHKGGPRNGGEAWADYSAATHQVSNIPEVKSLYGANNVPVSKLMEMNKTIADSYTSLAKALGVKAKDFTVGFGFSTDPQGTAASTVATSLADANGNWLLVQRNNGVARNDEALQAEMQLQANRAVLAALKNSDLPQALRTVLDKIDLSKATKEQVEAVQADLQAIAQVSQAFDAIGKVMPRLSILSIDAKMAIAALAGGIETLAGQVNGYYETFYSDSERLAIKQADVARALEGVGLSLPASKRSFRELVESLDLTTEQGQLAYATLMAVSGSFAEVANAAEQQMSSYRDAVQRAYDRESSEKQQLIDRLKSYADGLVKLRKSLLLSDLSTLSPEQKYAEARAQYESVLAKANGGDEAAQSQLESAAQAFLQASRDYNASNSQYVADFDRVQAQLSVAEVLGRSQISIAEQQLASMREMVAGIINVSTAVQTLAEAVAQYQASVSSKSSLDALYQQYLGRAPDAAGAAYWQTMISTGGLTPAQVADNIANSTEARVNGLYRDLLGRQSDYAGVQYWRHQLDSGAMTPDQVAAAIRDSEEYKKLNGSHASGLANVPFDGYVAELHRGERVLTAAENAAYTVAIRRSVQPSSQREAALIAAVEALRDEVAQLRAERREDASAGRQQVGAIGTALLKQGGEQAKQLARARADQI